MSALVFKFEYIYQRDKKAIELPIKRTEATNSSVIQTSNNERELNVWKY